MRHSTRALVGIMLLGWSCCQATAAETRFAMVADLAEVATPTVTQPPDAAPASEIASSPPASRRSSSQSSRRLRPQSSDRRRARAALDDRFAHSPK